MSKERDYLLEFKAAKEAKEALETQLSEANKIFDEKKFQLIEYLQDKNAKSTAKYDGIGSASWIAPRVYAEFDKNCEEELFEFIRQSGEGEIIKLQVHPSSLSGFISRVLEEGKSIPDYVGVRFEYGLQFRKK